MPPKKRSALTRKNNGTNGTQKSTPQRSHFDDSDTDSDKSSNADPPFRSSQTLMGSHNTLKQLLAGPSSDSVAQTPIKKVGRPAKKSQPISPINSASTPISRLKHATAQLGISDDFKRTSIHFDDIEHSQPSQKRIRSSKSKDRALSFNKSKNKKASKQRGRPRAPAQSKNINTNGFLQDSSDNETGYIEQVSQHTVDLTDDTDINSSNRRSSYNNRGKRVSSIGNGFVARPHSEVSIKEFYKSLDASMSEPNRMRQVLTWCFRKSLEKEETGSVLAGSETSRGIAKVITQEIFEDLAQGTISTSWYSLNDTQSTTSKSDIEVGGKRIILPNPLNESNKETIEVFKRKLQQLQSEKTQWLEAYNSSVRNLEDVVAETSGNTREALMDYMKAKGKHIDVEATLSNDFIRQIQSTIDDTRLALKDDLSFNVDKLHHLSHKMKSSLNLVSKLEENLLSNQVAYLVQRFMGKGEQHVGLPFKDLLRGISKLDARISKNTLRETAA